MSEKHYNIEYLQQTGNFLKKIKDHSYEPFSSLSEGKILDIGCGTGQDILNMAKQLSPEIDFIGIDHDKGMIEKANSSKQLNNNILFIQGEVYQLDFEDNTVSGIRTERMIQHLKEPEKAMQEMHRVLKPGKPIVIIETDWQSLSFYTPYTPIATKIISYLTEKKVNNGYAAKSLTHYLGSCDFKNISLEIFPFIINSLEEANQYLYIEVIIDEAKNHGYITHKEHELFMNALREADRKNHFCCSINLVISTSTK